MTVIWLVAQIFRAHLSKAIHDTIEEAIFNCVDVVKMIVAYRAERNESLDKKEIKFALSNVIEHKGKENILLNLFVVKFWIGMVSY